MKSRLLALLVSAALRVDAQNSGGNQSAPKPMIVHEENSDSQVSTELFLDILKTESPESLYSAKWTYYDDDSSYAKRDTILLVNSRAYFDQPLGCYPTEWNVDTGTDQVYVHSPGYQCKEPPAGGPKGVVFRIATAKKDGLLQLKLLDEKEKPSDQFRVLKVEFVSGDFGAAHYRLTLLRSNH